MPAGGAEDTPAFALPGESGFTRFTLHEYADLVTGANGECEREDPSDSRTPYDSSWKFERASRLLSWDDCNRSAKMLERGTVTLTDAEVRQLYEKMAQIAPTRQMDSDPCRADGGYAEVDIVVQETTTRYRASSGWCGKPPSDQNAVDGLLYFLTWVRSVAHAP